MNSEIRAYLVREDGWIDDGRMIERIPGMGARVLAGVRVLTSV